MVDQKEGLALISVVFWSVSCQRRRVIQRGNLYFL